LTIAPDRIWRLTETVELLAARRRTFAVHIDGYGASIRRTRRG
jgi:hypothetical protein